MLLSLLYDFVLHLLDGEDFAAHADWLRQLKELGSDAQIYGPDHSNVTLQWKSFQQTFRDTPITAEQVDAMRWVKTGAVSLMPITDPTNGTHSGRIELVRQDIMLELAPNHLIVGLSSYTKANAIQFLHQHQILGTPTQYAG